MTAIICPGCGWTGPRKTLYNGAGPECQYENADGDLLTVAEMLESDGVYNDVRLDLFLKAFMRETA